MREMILIFFTKTGEETALRITKKLAADSDWVMRLQRGSPLHEVIASVFRRDHILVFIGAIGIAVRSVASRLRSKISDPPVIVIDEQGRYVIPLLSGHLGGANRIALRMASLIEATPIITTATDLHHVFSVDTYAMENGYSILNPEMIKYVSARLLEKGIVGFSCDYEIDGPLPENIVLDAHEEVGIYLGESDKHPFKKTLRLVPKRFHIGIGAKRGVAFDALHDFFIETLRICAIPIEAIGSLSSIDLKHDEEAINVLAKRYQIPFHVYSSGELQRHEQHFACSTFVRAKTGVGNVSEISAWLSSNQGEIILEKTTRQGMTMAIGKEFWQVRFPVDEEVRS